MRGEGSNQISSEPAGASPFDEALALRSVGGDRELLGVIIDAFLDECPRLTAALAKAIIGGDGAGARLAAHTLKGAFSTLGASEARSLAQQLETLAHISDCSLDTTRSDLQARQSDLLASLSRLSPALAEFRRTQ